MNENLRFMLVDAAVLECIMLANESVYMCFSAVCFSSGCEVGENFCVWHEKFL